MSVLRTGRGVQVGGGGGISAKKCSWGLKTHKKKIGGGGFPY